MKKLFQFAFRFRFASIPIVVVGLLILVPLASFASGLFYIDSDTGFAGFGNITPQTRVDVSGTIYSRMVAASSSTIDWSQGNVQHVKDPIR